MQPFSSTEAFAPQRSIPGNRFARAACDKDASAVTERTQAL
jgi:hypothetical protein